MEQENRLTTELSASSHRSERHVGFELLRIVSMAMIVMMHMIGHGGLRSSVADGSTFYYIYWLLYALGRVSTNCFVMLTGYYMVTSSIKPSRLFRIACQVMFYSLLTFFIAWRAGYTELTPNTLLSAVTPITSEGYWFASAYFLLYLTIPLLNRAIRGITDRRSYSRILIIMLIVTSVWPTVFYWSDPMLVNGGYSYVWFIVLYFLAAYIRLYGLSVKRRTCILVYFGLALIVPFTRLAATYLQTRLGATTLIDNVMDYKMPITVIMTVALFLIFKDIDIKNQVMRRLILWAAPLSFGVYLLHDSDYIRPLLWDIVDAPRFGASPLTLLYMAAVITAVVLAGYAVDWLYHQLYRLLHFRSLERRMDALAARVFSDVEKKN